MAKIVSVYSNYMLIFERLLWARAGGWVYVFSSKSSFKPNSKPTFRFLYPSTFSKDEVFLQVELQLNQNNGRITTDGELS
jgi:hypothetical protein